MLKKLRWVLWGLVLVALAVNLGLLLKGQRDGGRVTTAPSSQTETPIRPSFGLTDHRGDRVSQQDYRGKWVVAFFGFTNCPDICPTTLTELSVVLDGLGDKAGQVAPLFISVDPLRDGVQQLAAYVGAFHPAIVGLTGSEAEIDTAAKAFGAFYARKPDASAPDGYEVSHSAMLFLLSPSGEFVRTYAYEMPPEEILADLTGRL